MPNERNNSPELVNSAKDSFPSGGNVFYEENSGDLNASPVNALVDIDGDAYGFSNYEESPILNVEEDEYDRNVI